MRLSARRRPGQAKEPGGAHWRRTGALYFLLEVPRRCETKLNETLNFGGRRAEICGADFNCLHSLHRYF